MKIAHLITSLKVGGAESALYNFLKNCDHKKDKHVVIFFYQGSNLEKIKKLGIEVYQVRGLFSIYDPLLFFRLFSIIFLANFTKWATDQSS